MKLIRGFGYNLGGLYDYRKDGKDTKAYKSWYNMLQRCYNHKYHETHPTYIGCTVHPKWHDFQVFAEWFYTNKYSDMGYHLDKDLLVRGNKIYSNETCCFVPSELNTLCNGYENARGEHPQGIYWNKPIKKYLSRLRVNGKHKHLGYFKCPEEAYIVYKTAKEAHIKVKANEWRDRIAPEVYKALMAWELT